jgi:hypothetical protein
MRNRLLCKGCSETALAKRIIETLDEAGFPTGLINRPMAFGWEDHGIAYFKPMRADLLNRRQGRATSAGSSSGSEVVQKWPSVRDNLLTMR